MDNQVRDAAERVAARLRGRGTDVGPAFVADLIAEALAQVNVDTGLRRPEARDALVGLVARRAYEDPAIVRAILDELEAESVWQEPIAVAALEPDGDEDGRSWWDGTKWMPATSDSPSQVRGQVELPTKEERVWSLMSHLSAFVLLPIIAPVAIIRMAGRRSSYVHHHAMEAVGFQVSVAVIAIAVFLVDVGLSIALPESAAGRLLQTAFGSALLVTALVFPIRAAIKSYRGQLYRYPFSSRFRHGHDQPEAEGTLAKVMRRG